jgi:hypothetical protein
MTDHEQALAELHARLGYRRLSGGWAKAEILLGLLAAGAGLFLGQWALSRPDPAVPWGAAAGGLALFALGGYLALAGQRSHLYRAANERAAYVIAEVRRALPHPPPGASQSPGDETTVIHIAPRPQEARRGPAQGVANPERS